MFPKKGKFFPDRRRRKGTEIQLEKVIRDALRNELKGASGRAKVVMDWTGASERTVKNWLLARGSPNGLHLICLMRHSRQVLKAMLELAGKEQVTAGMEIVEARNALAETVRRIDQIAKIRRDATQG